MPIQYRANVNLNKNELQNPVVHKLGSAPGSPVAGQIYYNTADGNAYIYDGIATAWVDLTSQGTTPPNATTGAVGLIQLAGDLGGTSTSATVPVISDNAITTVKINALAVTSAKIAAGAVGTTQLTDAGVTGGTAGAGVKIAANTITAANIAASTITHTEVAAANKDGASGTPSLRTLGAGAAQAAAGNDTRLSDARTPTAHAASHAPGGSDALPWGTAHGYGVNASKPVAASTNTGYLYYSTDVSGGTLYRSNGTTYDTVGIAVTHTHAESDVTNLVTDLAAKSPLASPTFTGTPAAPTAAVDTNTTQIATTAYVIGQTYLKTATATSTYAPIASPTFTGVPAAPTASGGTNTTQVATTAYVMTRTPIDAAVGTGSMRTLGTGSTQAAAGDHTHAQLHTQNTDTGTSATGFTLVGTTASDVQVRKTATGELSARLGDNSAYAAVQTGALTVNGNLSVTGTTTTINSNTLSVGDNIITLNNDVSTTVGTTENAGFEVQRYTGANVPQFTSVYWDETSDRFFNTIPASSGTGTVSKISAMKHVDVLGAVTGGSAVTVTHSLNTRDVAVSIRDTSTNEFVFADVIANSVDTIQVTFAASAGAGAYDVIVVG